MPYEQLITITQKAFTVRFDRVLSNALHMLLVRNIHVGRVEWWGGVVRVSVEGAWCDVCALGRSEVAGVSVRDESVPNKIIRYGVSACWIECAGMYCADSRLFNLLCQRMIHKDMCPICT